MWKFLGNGTVTGQHLKRQSMKNEAKPEEHTLEEFKMFKNSNYTYIPRVYDGASFRDEYFECRLRIFPVTYTDISSASVQAFMTQVPGVSSFVYFEKTLGVVDILCMFKLLKFVMKRVLSAKYERGEIKVDVIKCDKDEEKVWGEDELVKYPCFDCRASFKFKAGFVDSTWLEKKSDRKGLGEETPRSVYLLNVPANASSKVLRSLFPYALACSRKDVEGEGSAVLAMKSEEIVSAHLSNVTDLIINGSEVEMCQASALPAVKDTVEHYTLQQAEQASALEELNSALENLKKASSADPGEATQSQSALEAAKEAADKAAAILESCQAESEDEKDEVEDTVFKEFGLGKEQVLNRKCKGSCPSDMRRSRRKQQEYMAKLNDVAAKFGPQMEPPPFPGEAHFVHPPHPPRPGGKRPLLDMPMPPPFPGARRLAGEPGRPPLRNRPPGFGDRPPGFGDHPPGFGERPPPGFGDGPPGLRRRRPPPAFGDGPPGFGDRPPGFPPGRRHPAGFGDRRPGLAEGPPPFPGEQFFEEHYPPERRLPVPDMADEEPPVRRLARMDVDDLPPPPPPPRRPASRDEIMWRRALSPAARLQLEMEEEELALRYGLPPPPKYPWSEEDDLDYPLPPPGRLPPRRLPPPHDLYPYDFDDEDDLDFLPPPPLDLLHRRRYYDFEFEDYPPPPRPLMEMAGVVGLHEPPLKRTKWAKHPAAEAKKRERDRIRMTKFVQKKTAESGGVVKGGSVSAKGQIATKTSKTANAEWFEGWQGAGAADFTQDVPVHGVKPSAAANSAQRTSQASHNAASSSQSQPNAGGAVQRKQTNPYTWQKGKTVQPQVTGQGQGKPVQPPVAGQRQNPQGKPIQPQVAGQRPNPQGKPVQPLVTGQRSNQSSKPSGGHQGSNPQRPSRWGQQSGGNAKGQQQAGQNANWQQQQQQQKTAQNANWQQQQTGQNANWQQQQQQTGQNASNKQQQKYQSFWQKGGILDRDAAQKPAENTRTASQAPAAKRSAQTGSSQATTTAEWNWQNYGYGSGDEYGQGSRQASGQQQDYSYGQSGQSSEYGQGDYTQGRGQSGDYSQRQGQSGDYSQGQGQSYDYSQGQSYY